MSQLNLYCSEQQSHSSMAPIWKYVHQDLPSTILSVSVRESICRLWLRARDHSELLLLMALSYYTSTIDFVFCHTCMHYNYEKVRIWKLSYETMPWHSLYCSWQDFFSVKHNLCLFNSSYFLPMRVNVWLTITSTCTKKPFNFCKWPRINYSCICV